MKSWLYDDDVDNFCIELSTYLTIQVDHPDPVYISDPPLMIWVLVQEELTCVKLFVKREWKVLRELLLKFPYYFVVVFPGKMVLINHA